MPVLGLQQYKAFVRASCSTKNTLIEHSPNPNDQIECTATNKDNIIVYWLCTNTVHQLTLPS